MSNSTPRIVICPTCRARVKWTPGNEHRPFCSERCKLIDLGAWAGEQHRIAGNSIDDDVLSGSLEDPPQPD
ncbi:MAG: DNA gyrase inhibitor YacG [Pseudomonadales bacterium]